MILTIDTERLTLLVDGHPSNGKMNIEITPYLDTPEFESDRFRGRDVCFALPRRIGARLNITVDIDAPSKP